MAMLPWLLLYAGLHYVRGQLVINVSKGTEQSSVYQEMITGNTTSDTVTIQYLTPEGDSVKQVSDLKNKVLITVYTIPGEEELGQFTYQVFCFISAHNGDMIPSEAVTKLRQKHSRTVRVAEEHKGSTVQNNPANLIMSRAGILSPQIPLLCREAKYTTFTSEEQLKKIVSNPSKISSLIKKSSLPYESTESCSAVSTSSSSPCVCELSSCVWWYPCSLKYCRSPGGESEHRCGIRTCSRCISHRFLVNQPDRCSWEMH